MSKRLIRIFLVVFVFAAALGQSTAAKRLSPTQLRAKQERAKQLREKRKAGGPEVPDVDFVDGVPVVEITSPNDPARPVAGGVRWFWPQFQKHLNQTKQGNFDLCLLGDSITAMWPGDMLGKYFGKYKTVNFGLGGDRAENVLFRLEHGMLKDTSPKVIVLLLGTNNQGMNNAEEVAYGVCVVIKKLRTVCPESKILLLGIFPSKGTPYERTKKSNAILAMLDDGKTIRYFDSGAHMLDEEGNILDGVLADGVHLTRKGFSIWGDTMKPLLDEMMKK